MHTSPQTMEHPETTYACPLCEHRSETATDVYVHLQVSHRKSEISEALIEATTDAGTRSELADR
ncbi:hypothetical protein EGH21_07070 [Halomicroarcula sp. F13]|uniref:C2H2-type domain-containing protein n=1 Tax=Haloarcula rubra TaxID=2487747 RepID=A0AAW4PNX3_9EURY|nr:hypothetical protein [Halomicroarcula rubra]MBX0322789.1 hypothetical protein [Halomicroarcula rubra]